MVKLLAVNIQAVAQLILQHLRVSNDGVERRPEFMTDVGEEHALRRVGRIGIGPRGVHLFNGDLQLGRHVVECSG